MSEGDITLKIAAESYVETTLALNDEGIAPEAQWLGIASSVAVLCEEVAKRHGKPREIVLRDFADLVAQVWKRVDQEEGG